MKRDTRHSNHLLRFLIFFVLSFFLFQSPAFPAASSYLDTVQKIYIGYYQRPADPAGLLYWAERLDSSGGNLNEIIEAFATSEESRALYGPINSGNISTVVNDIYLALLSRNAEDEGRDWYVGEFNAGRFTSATIMLNILNGTTQGADLQSINNKLAAANSFTRTIDPELDGSNLQVTYAGDGDATAGRNFLAFVTSDSTTVPTQDQTRAYINANIADPGDPLTSDNSAEYVSQIADLGDGLAFGRISEADFDTQLSGIFATIENSPNALQQFEAYLDAFGSSPSALMQDESTRNAITARAEILVDSQNSPSYQKLLDFFKKQWETAYSKLANSTTARGIAIGIFKAVTFIEVGVHCNKTCIGEDCCSGALQTWWNGDYADATKAAYAQAGEPAPPWLTVTPPTPTAVTGPISLSAETQCSDPTSIIVLTWSSVAGATYEIYRGTGLYRTTTQTSFEDYVITPGESYSYRVMAQYLPTSGSNTVNVVAETCGASPFRGSIPDGLWSGTCPSYGGSTPSGSFSLTIDASGVATGNYSGSSSGSITGTITSSGDFLAHGSGSGDVRWVGKFSDNGGTFLSGSGTWSDPYCSGDWSGTGTLAR